MNIGFDYTGITTPFYCHDGQGNLLLHKRTAECRDEHHRWDPGSGKLEHGLSLEANALKEVEEEYGCAGIVGESLPAHDIFREQKGVMTHWVAVPFFVRVKREEVRNNEPHKMAELGWFPLDALPEPLHSGFSITLSKYREHFERIIGPKR